VVPRRRRLNLRFDATGNDQGLWSGRREDLTLLCVRLRVANGAGKDTTDDVVVMVTAVVSEEIERCRGARLRAFCKHRASAGMSPRPVSVQRVRPDLA
jgi:hypothetical protein